MSINQTQPGIDQLRGALRLDPKLAVAHAWLAEALLKDGQKELALESARTARQLGYKEKIGDLEVTSEALPTQSGSAKP